MKVAVIGAGFAGLAAADLLQSAGVEVAVFEARERVGGRVWSQPFGGAVVERGAEFITDVDTVLLGLARRFGLEPVPKRMEESTWRRVGGLGATEAELHAAMAQIDGALPAALREVDAGRRQSVQAFLAGVAMTEGAREVLTARIELNNAMSAAQMDMAMLGDSADAEYAPAPSYTLAGGNQRLADALAGGLRLLHLRSPVQRVTRPQPDDVSHATVRGGPLRVVTREGEWQADAVVVAVPASVIDRIDFQPALPEATRAALAHVAYGQAAKLFVALPEAVPPSVLYDVPLRMSAYTSAGSWGERAPVLSSFVGTAGALQSLDVAGGPQRWLARLAAARPDLALDAQRTLLSTWQDDPWIGAVYSSHAVDTPADNVDVLRRPVGGLHFCGEHTADLAFVGYMEGALRSGLRAGQDILRAAGRG